MTPAGEYTLALDRPYERAIAAELVAMHAARVGTIDRMHYQADGAADPTALTRKVRALVRPSRPR
jgi:hypothetical protein